MTSYRLHPHVTGHRHPIFLFPFHRRCLFGMPGLLSHLCLLLAPLAPLERSKGSNTIKTYGFLTVQKSLRGPLERLRAAQRASPGASFGLGARLRGALGTSEIPDCPPLGRPGPLRGLLLGCHTLIFCEKKRVRANIKKINFTQ